MIVPLHALQHQARSLKMNGHNDFHRHQGAAEKRRGKTTPRLQYGDPRM